MDYHNALKSKLNILSALIQRGWRIYGYQAQDHEHNQIQAQQGVSDTTKSVPTPISWGGIAEKNGFILCIGVDDFDVNLYSGKVMYQKIVQPNSTSTKVHKKIEKLVLLAKDAGASKGQFGEAETALKKIEILLTKQKTRLEARNLKEQFPVFMSNPPGYNWHIEKDGIIVDKGTNAYKFGDMSPTSICDLLQCLEDYSLNTEQVLQGQKKQKEVVAEFLHFIENLERNTYLKLGNIPATTHKTFYQSKECKIDSFQSVIEPDVCFQLNSDFNNGRARGNVYQIKEITSKKIVACRFDDKQANNPFQPLDKAHCFQCSYENLDRWIKEGHITIVNIETVPTLGEDNKLQGLDKESESISLMVQGFHLKVIKDIHTKTTKLIYVVKAAERLSKAQFEKLRQLLVSVDANSYYSKFKHGFIFAENPIEALLAATAIEEGQEEIMNSKFFKTPKKKKYQKEKLLTSIDKQLTAMASRIDFLSMDRKVNTAKRVREEAGRIAEKERIEKRMKLLSYIRLQVDQEMASELEMSLITGTFRETLIGYYRLKYGHYPKEIKFPEIDDNLPKDGWYNLDVPKRRKRLMKANIYNTTDLIKAVDDFKPIYESVTTISQAEKNKAEIKLMENKFRLTQQGDIQFTPQNVAAQLIDLACIDENSVVLEPSAGIGSIADEIKRITSNVECCEWLYSFREFLEKKGHQVVADDFLSYEKLDYYDAIIMNPPFSKNQDIKHIKHAYHMLKDGGRLVSLSSSHWRFANDASSTEHRGWIEELDHEIINLGHNVFDRTNTTINIVVLHKPEIDLDNDTSKISEHHDSQSTAIVDFKIDDNKILHESVVCVVSETTGNKESIEVQYEFVGDQLKIAV